MAKELAQTVGGKKIAFLLAILAAFAVLATLGNRWDNSASATVSNVSLSSTASVLGPGDTVTYTLSADSDNSGEVSLTIEVPVLVDSNGAPALVFTSLDCSPGANPTETDSGNTDTTASCDYAGANDTFVMTATFTAVSPIGNTTDAAGLATGTASDDDNVLSDSENVRVVGPDVLFDKTVTALSTPCEAGTCAGTYTISISENANVGPQSDADDVSFIDELDSNLTIVSVTETSGSGSCTFTATPPVVTCTGFDVAAGTTENIDVDFVVSPGIPTTPYDVENFLDDADLSAANVNGLVGLGPVTFVVVGELALEAVKTSSPSIVTSDPVEEFVWIFTVTNTGTVDLDQVVITDPQLSGDGVSAEPVPGQTFTGSAAGCVITGAGVTASLVCDLTGQPGLDPLVAGASVTIEVLMRTILDTPEVTVFNDAVVEAVGIPAVQNFGGTVVIDNDPILSISKTADSSQVGFGAAQDVTYTITVTNNGNVQADDVVIADVLPAGLTETASTCTSPQDIPANDDYSCTVTAVLTAGTTPADGSSFVNTASATYGGVTITASETVSAIVPVIEVEKVANSGNITSEDDSESFDIIVRNTGSAPSGTITVTDTPGAQLEVNGLPIANIATLAAGASQTITVTAQADDAAVDGTVLTNTVCVSQAAPIPSGDCDDATTTVQAPKLEITKMPSANPVSSNPTGNFNWLIIVSNTGSVTAENVTVDDVVPAELTVVGGDFSVTTTTGSLDCTVTGNTVNCAGTNTLAPGASVSISIPVSVDAGLANADQITNTATADCDNCPNSVSGSANVNILNQPVLSMSKVANSDPVVAGAVASYTITIVNNGGAAAVVDITDAVPAILTGATAQVTNGGGSTVACDPIAGGEIDCDGTINAGATVTILVSGTVPAGTANGTVLLNEVTLTSPTMPGTTLTASAAINVVAATLTVTKTNAPGVIGQNGVVTSTITVTNNGNSTANNVGIFDDLPAGTTFVATGSTVTCVAAGNQITTLTAAGNNTTTITVADGSRLLVDAVISVNGNTRTVTAINGNTVTLDAALTAAQAPNGTAVTYVGSASAEVMCTATTPNAALTQGSSTTFTVNYNVGTNTGILVNTAFTSNSSGFPDGSAQAAVTVLGAVVGAGLVHVDVDAASESASHGLGATDPNQVLHDPGSSETQPALIDDIDDATGSLHTVCLISPTLGLNDQANINWSIQNTSGSLATIVPAGGTKVVLNIVDALYNDPQANCVQWRSGGVGGQTVTATHAITGQVFNSIVDGTTPLIKEWSDIDVTKIVSVLGNVGDTLFANTQDLASWMALAPNATCIRNADSDDPAPAGTCLAKPNVDQTVITAPGPVIAGGGTAGNLLPGNFSFIEYALGDHNGRTAVDYSGPVDGVRQTFTITGTCGTARVENPVTGVTAIIDANAGDATYPNSVTVINSDKGVGFQILPNRNGAFTTTTSNANCAPGEWARVTITSREDVQLNSDLDTAPDEWVEVRYVTAPPPQKQILLAWAGQRVILEHDWRINNDSNGHILPAHDVDSETIPADPHAGNVCPFTDDFRAHYVRGFGPGNFLPSLGVDIQGNDDAVVWVENSSVDQVNDDSDPLVAGNENCISRVLYESEDPGEVDIELFIDEVDDQDDFADLTKVAFVVYYMKFESIELSIVDDVSKPTHNGPSLTEPLSGDATTLYDYADWAPSNPWNVANDSESITENVSADVLLRGRVKGWFNNSNPSGRAAVNDPTGQNSLPANRWVMPDDWDRLAGGPTGEEVKGVAEEFRPDYDLMIAPNNVGVGTGVPFLCATPWGGCSELLTVTLNPDGTVASTAQTYNIVAPVEGPFSLLDIRGPLSAALSNLDPTTVRNTIVRDGDVDWWDAPMPPAIVSVDIRDSGFLKQVRKADVYYTGRTNGHWGLVGLGGQDFTNPFYWSNIPDSMHIPANVAGGGYIWDSWGSDGAGGEGDGPYEFWTAVPWFLGYDLPASNPASVNTNPQGIYDTSVTLSQRSELHDIRRAYCDIWSSNKAEDNACNIMTSPDTNEVADDARAIGRTLVVFTDNHGEFMAAANGDFRLTYADCALNTFYAGTNRHCDVDDEVGSSRIYATVDYPDFRGKHFPMRSNETDITWTWGGYKEVTIEDGESDQFRYLVFRAKDRDGFCWIPEGAVSLHPVLSAADEWDTVGGGGIVSATKTSLTTLSETLTPQSNTVLLASTAGLAVGDWIAIGNEYLEITSVNSATSVSVWRPSPVQHVSGAVVFKATNIVMGGADPVESVDFLIDAGEGIIVDTNGGLGYVNDGRQFAEGLPTYSVLANNPAVTGIREFAPLDGSNDECQAWIRVSNSLLGILNVLTTAYDDEGTLGFDRIIDFSSTSSYTLTFRWSLITWAGQDGISPTDALRGTVGEDSNDIFDEVTAIYGWDQSAQEWLAFFPAGVSVPGANDLTALENGAAYWVAIEGPDPVTWTIATDID